MKRILLTAALLVATVSAMAQGTVSFKSKVGTTVDAPVTKADTGAPVDITFLAQLYAGATADSLSPIGKAYNFVGTKGYFSTSDTLTITGITHGGAAVCQVKAWASAGGTSFEAVDQTKFYKGESTVFTLASTGDPTTSPPGLPVDLVGLKGFTVSVTGTTVPEPTTLALGALAAGALLLFRRK